MALKFVHGKGFKQNFLLFFVFLSIVGLSFTDLNEWKTPAPGVVAELRCNEGTGTTTADASGNGYNGTLTNGPTWGAGKYGQGINYDGTNDYVNIADNANFTLTPTLSYSWSAWVKNNNFNQWSTIWSQTLSATNFFYFYAHTSTDPEAGPVTNGVSVYWYSGNNKLVIHSNNNVLTAGQWSNVAVTYDASVAQNLRFTIYVNGVDVTNRTDVVSTGTIAAIDPTNIRIGSNQPYGEYLNGSVDEVRYYRRLISLAEVQSDMNIGNDTELPTVSITAPAAGNASGTISVSANAADNTGVAGVQFLLDGVNLGAEDIVAPYSISWNTATATNGNHTLTARARDASGNIATSTSVIVTLDNDILLPTVSITAPAGGNISGTIDVTANASDNIGVIGVQFLLDGVNLGTEDIVAPYSFSWNTLTTTNGNHTLTARARDAAGNTATSAGVIVTVNNDTQLPTVSITAPAAGNVLGTINVTANASDNTGVVGVQFLLNGVNLGAEDIVAPYTVSWNTLTAANGTYTLTARARDAAGNAATSSGVVVTVNNDTQLPTVTITAPAAGNVLGTINVTANASDNLGVVGVQFLLDGASLGAEDITAPYSVSWNTLTVVNGAHTITAIARDAAGNTATSAGVIVTVANDSQLPTISITAPAAGNVSGTINVTADASDNVGVSGVQFLLDGINLGAEDLAAPYSVSWNTLSIINGSHTLTARARDAAGNAATSTSIIVTINNDIELPTVAITSPAAGTVAGTLNVTADASDNVGITGVQFLLDGVNLDAEDVSAPYSISWNTATIADGNHTLTARARDAAGNSTTSAGIIVTVHNDTELPTVNITAPGAGNVAGIISITASAADNTVVAGVQFLIDGVNLGTEDITAPYSVSWNTLTAANGNHTLTAVARDASGNTATSAGVIVTVNNDIELPVVSVTAPVSGTVTGTLNVTADASDNIGVIGVQFLLDGVNLGAEDVAAPYSVSWNTSTATNGSHTLTARARDASGNIATSTGVIVTVSNDTQLPTVSITAPAAGNVSATINVTANASDNIGVIGVQFLLDGVNLGAEDIAAPYSVSWNTLATANGSHTLTAIARDAAGNTATSAAVIVTVNNDIQVPTVTITAPAAGNVSATINVTANASDNVGVVGVQFLLDGVNLGAEDIAAPYSVSWNTLTTANGSHTLTAIARDAAGNTATSTGVIVTVNNDTQLPAVSITAPAAGNVSGTINVTANASDNVGVSGVQFLLDGVNLGSEDVAAPYSVSWVTTGTINGSHTLTARARDAAGNSTTSSAVIVTVNNTNLVAAYGFTENTGTTATDNSGNGNNGTLTNGPTWSASGKYGAAILFDGTNDLVNINDANSLDLTNGMTIEAWINPTDLTGYKTVISKENGTTNLAYALSANNSTSGAANQRPNSRFVTGTTTRTVTGTTKLTLNTWTHIASTYDGTTLRFYVNGVQVSTLATTGNIITTTNMLRIGGSPNLGTQYFAGLIDEVRVYNRALSQAEIQTDMNTPVAPDVTNPTVSITAPVAGNVSGTINVTANAADNISVTGVQFLLDGVNLGAEDIVAPYSVSWNTLTATNGTHTLTARARDAAGNITTSTGIIVTVFNDTEAPAVAITAPAPGNVLGTINVTADASDNVAVAGVQFLLNGVNLGTEDVTVPFAVSWNTTTVVNGIYTLTARARDAAGNNATSATVSVTVNNPDIQLPTVSITAPAAGNVLGTINVTANASDNIGVAGVQFLLNGVNLGTEDIAAPYSISWNTLTSANGTYTLTAVARDAAGNTSTSAGVVVTINNDLQPPTITITAPAAGTVTGTLNVTANATDNIGVTGVQFLLDGVNLGAEDVATPYSVSWNTLTAANGSHTLTAVARDAAGNAATSAAVIVTVFNDTQVPTVSITAPVPGTVTGTINVNANAADNVGVVGVQFMLNGVNLGTEDVTAPYSISWSTLTSANGTYTLTARARDAAGNTAISTGVIVTVFNDTQLPTVSITAPVAGNVSGNINVTANAADNVGVAGVQFLLNGSNLGAEDIASPFSISWNTSGVPNGSYTLTASARDVAGNIATSSAVNVTVNNPVTLVTALNFNEGSGTTAADMSGNNHYGILTNGPTWGAGKYGQGVNTDGNDYVDIPDHADFSLDPAQSYTWAAWVKNNNFNEWSTVWSQTVNSDNFFYFYAHTTTDPDGGPVTNGVSAYWWTSGGTHKLGAHSSNNVLTAGQWSYIAVTYDGTQTQNNRFTIYVNGIDVTVRTDVSSSGTLAAINPGYVRIGANQPYGDYLNGSVDEVKFYRRLLSLAEVQADMNTAIPTVLVPVVAPVNGATGINTGTTITGVFNVTMNASTINSSSIELRDASNVLVASVISYNATTRTATLTPSAALANSSVYFAKIKGGSSGVKDASGNAMANDYSWSFTTSSPPPPPPTDGPGGPILVIGTSTNPFSRYTSEILRAEGLNEFFAMDISAVNATVLNSYDVVILGEMTVTAAQVTMLTDWVNAGGKLIAFRPTSLLTPLLGISSATGTLADKYLLVNTASGPGAGIVNQTIQFHGTANLHTLSGATSLATLYSSATAATTNPAVTTRNVGSNGGMAIAFTYDLARSIVYTRQGNPAFAATETDGQSPIRPDDLFYPTYVDLNKVAIPQADEQQRLLANIIIQSNLAKKPLPRFWYMPNGYKAALIYALDDHGSSSGTKDIFDKMIANSTIGCSVDDWQCYRATSWFYVGIPLTTTQASSYNSQGFEMGTHVQNGCANFTSFNNLDASYTNQLGQFASTYPALPQQTTHRFHCLVWSDWLTQARVELSHGIRFSLDYYYWPPAWANGRPGMFTGSGIPMRFADTNGDMIDIYQGVSQLVNENGIDYAVDANTVFDNALGSLGYYGMFGAHDDYTDVNYSNVTIASAKARNVPIITAKQALTWLDGRNSSSFGNLTWSNNQLSFSIIATSGARNINAMLPLFSSTGGQLSSITRNGGSVSFTTQTIKGMQYAFFAPVTGTFTYVATYSTAGARTAAAPPTITTEPELHETSVEKTAVEPITEEMPSVSKLTVNVMPNPSVGYFNMVITSNDAGHLTIRVLDIFGKTVEKHEKIAAGSVRIGQTLASGTYYAEVTQGDQRKVMKMVKVN